MEGLGDRIRLLRLARGLTQEQVAKACGVSAPAVSQWESNDATNIKLQPFLKLAEVLGTDAHFLLYGPSRRPPDEKSGLG